MSVPKLRFPEFDGEWVDQRLRNVVNTVTSGSRDWAQYYSNEGAKFIRMTNIPRDGIQLLLSDLKYVSLPESGSEGARTSLQAGDILVSITAELGKIGLVPDDLGEAYINQHTALVRPSLNKVAPELLAQLLATKSSNKRLNRLNDSGAKAGLNLGTVRAFKVCIPSLPEQKKIAAFLGVVDAKIAALRARRAGLERYKRGLMQALFSQTLRFTRSDGTAFPDWEEKRLGEVFERVTRKNAEDNQNVLTISAQQGLVNQRDYFNKSVSAQDVSGYYLLHKGDFAYNKSYSKGYPMGAIKRLNMYEKGVVSTLYICFRTKGETTAKFYEQFFEFGGLNREIHKIAQEGARNHGLLNMSVVEFFKDMIIPYPHPEEQAKIAEALSAMDAKIAAVGGQVTKMEAFKKGLLQQMFV